MCRVHSRVIVDNKSEFYHVWILKKIPQSSSIVKLRFLFRPFLFLDSERLYQFSSILLSGYDLVWQSFEFVSLLSGPHISF